MESMWIAMACILATVNIQKAVDEAGNVIEPSEEYSSGMLRFVYHLSFLGLCRSTDSM